MKFSLTLLSLPVAVYAAAAKPPPNFTLYGYGNGIEGLELFYSNGLAYLGNVTQPSQGGGPLALEDDATSVQFTQNDDNTWVAKPKGNGDSDWDEKLYYLPQDSSDSRQTGFVDEDDSSDVTTSPFTLYGQTALFSKDGMAQTNWYATQVDEGLDIWTLNWNTDNDYPEGSVSVSMKMWAPPPPPPRLG